MSERGIHSIFNNEFFEFKEISTTAHTRATVITDKKERKTDEMGLLATTNSSNQNYNATVILYIFPDYKSNSMLCYP